MKTIYPLLMAVLFCAVSCETKPETASKQIVESRILYQTRFADSASGWKAEGNSRWSSAARVPGKTGSLFVGKMNDKEANVTTRWLSPVIATGGKSVKVSFFAADNYLVQQDFSYAAHVTVRKSDAAGKEGNALVTAYTEWDNSVKSPYMWGRRTRENLIWRYYELIVPAGNPYLMLDFGFRGPLVRGSCYLTDVVVQENSAVTETKKDTGAKENSLLELSSPAVGGVFYEKDSLRFDASLRGMPEDAVLSVDVTDFEYNVLGKYTFELKDAVPCADASFYQSAAARKRNLTPENHRVKRFMLAGKKVQTPGMLYRVHAQLISGGKVFAEDTSLYGVAAMPDSIPANRGSRSFFWTRDVPGRYYDGGSCAGKSLKEQSMIRKSNSFRTCSLGESYNWRQLQPKYPGPVIIKHKLSAYPQQTYMPNVEQVNVARFIPDGAILPSNEKTYYAGRLDMPTVDYDAGAYADFILEYIRQNREAVDWVIPSGLERGLNKRVLILQKKVYEECKKRFPEIKVGFCINFVSVADFDKYELWRWSDFLNLHLYGANAGFPLAQTVTPYQVYYRTKLKKKIPPFTMTEGALRMPPGHTNYAAGSMRGIWSLLEQNFQGIYYYHQGNLGALKDPDTGDTRTPDPKSSVYDNYRFFQLVDRPIMAPELVMEQPYGNRRWDNAVIFGGGLSVLPTVSTMTYINLIRDFDNTSFRFSRLLPSAKVYCFEGKKNTVAGIDPREGSAGNPLIVNSDVPYLFRDVYGRTTRIIPVKGKSVIQTGKYPSTLIFERKVKNLSFKEMTQSGLQVFSGMSGAPFRCPVTLDSGFAVKGTCRISKVEQNFELGGKDVFPKLTPGEYPVRVFLKNGPAVCGILHSTLTIENPLSCRMNPCPGRNPGLEVLLNNRSGKSVSGTAVFRNDLLCVSVLPEIMKQRFTVKANSSGRIFFPVDRMMVKSVFNEFAGVVLKLDNGEVIQLKERLHFRGIAHAEKAPVIDGDLSDWPLKDLQGVLLERTRMSNPDEPAPEELTSRGRLYTMWKEDILYMAAVIHDTTPVSRHMDVGLWIDDNLLFGIYPWRHWSGEKYHAGFYRGHIGLHKNGSSGNYREPDVPAGGSVDTSKIRTAIRRQNGTIIYELAFPKGTLHPFVPAPGNGLRISMTCFDADGRLAGDFYGPLSYFGGANVNFHMDINQWFEFICLK